MRWLPLLALAACNFQHGSLGQAPRDGTVIDMASGPRDAATDGATMADANVDAQVVAGCSTVTCTSSGGTCNNGTCDITAPNNQPVACPTATKCDIRCPQDNASCRNGMTCGANAVCAFTCEADHTCDNTSLMCLAGSRCEIYCKGDHACIGTPITCSIGATCVYHCCGGNSCGSTFGCSGGGTCTNGGTNNCP